MVNLKKAWRTNPGDWQLYVLILPAVVYMFIFAYIPMYGLQIAFKDYRSGLGIMGSEWIGLKHFIRFVTFPNFWMIIKNTLRISLYSLSTFPCAVIFALLLNEIGNAKYKKTIQMISYAPHFLSTVVVCSLLRLFLAQDTGVINRIIEMLGGQRTEFITVASFFEDMYVWSGVWQNLGWGAIIYLAALSGVSYEMVESARVDGANRLQVIWHINIPSIMPTIVIMLILSCGGILSVGFEKVFLLQTPLNLSHSQVISTYVYDVGLRGSQFSYATAIGLFNTIVNVTLLAVVNMIAKKTSSVSIW